MIQMRWFLLLSLVVFFLNGIAVDCMAQEVAEAAGQAEQRSAETETTEQEPAEDSYSKMTLDELAEDFTTRIRAYSSRYRAAPTKEEKLEVFQTIPKVTAYMARMIELIDENPGSDAGLEVVEWWYRRGGRRENTDVIIGLLLKNYSQQASIEKYVPWFAWHLPGEDAEKGLRSLVDANPSAAVKASAIYHLHEVLKKRAEELAGDAEEIVSAEMKTLRDSIYQQYAEATDTRGAKFVDLLNAVEFASRLEIGEPVPDIVGTDLDGVDFKLSDYEGKVRVISFWGDW